MNTERTLKFLELRQAEKNWDKACEESESSESMANARESVMVLRAEFEAIKARQAAQK